MQACMMRCVVRDRRTNRIKGYGEPIVMPVRRAQHRMMMDPLAWEMVDEHVEVPDDDRGNPHRSEFSFAPAQSVEQLTGPSRARGKG